MSANQVVQLQEDKIQLAARWAQYVGLEGQRDGPERGRFAGRRGVLWTANYHDTCPALPLH